MWGRPIIAALALTAGCMQTEVGNQEDPIAPAHMLAPGQEILVFFQSGVDEPPASAQIVSCETASGLCLGGMEAPAPIRITDAGYAVAWDNTAVTLESDGSGTWDPESGPRIGITWMAQAR